MVKTLVVEANANTRTESAKIRNRRMLKKVCFLFLLRKCAIQWLEHMYVILIILFEIFMVGVCVRNLFGYRYGK